MKNILVNELSEHYWQMSPWNNIIRNAKAQASTNILANELLGPNEKQSGK